MEKTLFNSAYFIQKNELSDFEFYKELFYELEKKLDFSYGALYYKEGSKYSLKYENKLKRGKYKLKIPFKIQNSLSGYFLFEKDKVFTKKEKEIFKLNENIIGEKIKDFEISKIFQNQLLILKDAVLEKNIATKKLEEQNEKLIETDKIRSKFLANMSHELRTPLNSIIGFSTALKDGMAGPLNEKQKDCANKILSSAIQLTGIINDILDMTKIESDAVRLNLTSNNPNKIIQEVINIIEPLAYDKNIKIEKDLKFEGEIQADYIKFRQIISNLCSNAIKYSHPNSKIILKTKKTKNSFIFKIKDFGVGIDKKNHKKVFEKFVQLDNIYTKKYPSTGLGLTITDELVKLHKGKIILKSELNKGCEFTINIPL